MMYHQLYEQLKTEFGGQRRSPTLEATIDRRLQGLAPGRKFYPVWLNGYLCGVMEDTAPAVISNISVETKVKP